jgi:hypothetical protein
MRIHVTPLLTIVLLLGALGLGFRTIAEGDSATSNEPTVRVAPSNITDPGLSPSSNFTIAVQILNVTDLKGFDIQLHWNPALLNYTSHLVKIPVETYPDGVLHTQVLGAKDEVNATLGTYWIAFATINGPSFNGTGTVFEMTFTVLDYGACNLDLYNSDLADSTAQPIDHVVEVGYFSNLFYDVAVLSVTPSATVAFLGDTLNITVTVLNNGTSRSETFDVAVYGNDTVIAIQPVSSLAAGAEETLTFPWNTSAASPGSYVLSANATLVPDENMVSNNRLADGVVLLILEQIHDVAVVALTPFKTLVFPGFCFSANVTVENQGNVPENVSVTLYANNFAVAETQVALTESASVTLEFAWNVTTAVEYEFYLLNATAEAVLGEVDITDNTLFLSSVRAAHVGDFDADEDVDIFDIVQIAFAYGSEVGDPAYNPNLDLDCNHQINIFDIVLAASSYGYTRT